MRLCSVVGLHEFQKIVRTSRFWLLSAVTIALFPLSSLNFVDYYELQKAEERRVTDEAVATLRGLDAPTRLRSIELKVSKKIDANWLVMFGAERMVPTLAYFNLVDAAAVPEYPLVLNLFHSYTRYIDWVFIFAYCVSFSSLLLGHDAVSSEIETRTLHLVLANPMSRASFLLGKLLGILAAVTFPFLTGSALSLLMISEFGVPIHRQDLITFVLVILQSIIFVACLILLSVWISVTARTSAIALIWVVILWFYLIVLIPSLSNAAAAAIITVDASLMDEEIAESTRSTERPLLETTRQSRNGERSLRAYGEARQALRRDYDRTILQQLRVAQAISWVSPLALYTEAMQRMTGTGLIRHERFVSEVKRYMGELWEKSFQPNDIGVPLGTTVDEETFVEPQLSLAVRLRDSLGAMALVSLVALVAFFLLFVMFSKKSIC